MGALAGDEWEVFGRVSAVGFGESGNLYVMDDLGGRIVIVSPDALGFGRRIEEAVVHRETTLQGSKVPDHRAAPMAHKAGHRLAAPGNHDFLARLHPREKAGKVVLAS